MLMRLATEFLQFLAAAEVAHHALDVFGRAVQGELHEYVPSIRTRNARPRTHLRIAQLTAWLKRGFPAEIGALEHGINGRSRSRFYVYTPFIHDFSFESSAAESISRRFESLLIWYSNLQTLNLLNVLRFAYPSLDTLRSPEKSQRRRHCG
jgi:hypothetical protein